MAEFSMDKMARSVAEKVMEELKDSGVFDEDIISRKHLLSEIDDLMKSPWFNNGKDDYRSIPHYGYVVRKEAVEIVRDLCVKAEPSVAPKPETVTEFADRCRECGAKYGKLIKQKTGKWIIDEAETNLYGRGTRIWACHCSECGKDPQEEYIAGTENWWLSKLPNFCPNCGMKMEGEE